MDNKKVTFAFSNLPIHEIDIAAREGDLTKVGAGDKNDPNPNSTTVKSAKLYIFGCLFYNACFPCLPNSLCNVCGPWLGKEFCFGWVKEYGIILGRDTWLRILHSLCFLMHVTFFVVTFIVVDGNDMTVTVKRLRPLWGPNSNYFHTIRPANTQLVAFDTLTLLFFGASATMHAMWITIGWFDFARPFLWYCLDNCFCWWRWAEYSISASIMMVAIAITTGIADQNTLLGIFALTFITMWCGFFTEMVSRPATNTQGKVDYDRWEGDPDALKEDATDTDKRKHLQDRILNYGKRMFPHVMGFFPYTAAWFMIIGNWNDLLADIAGASCEDEDAPLWVQLIVYGCFVIFSFFTFVQWRYQWTAPKHYWRTEIWYCVLSASSKMGLGLLLFANVMSKTEEVDPLLFSRCKSAHDVEERCNQTLVDRRIAYIGCAGDIGY